LKMFHPCDKLTGAGNFIDTIAARANHFRKIAGKNLMFANRPLKSPPPLRRSFPAFVFSP
jgi:hypothetical protein